MLRWPGKLATVHPAYAKVRPLRRIFIAKLLSTALGVGSAVAPSQAAPTTPSSDTTPTESSAAVAGEYYIKSALADDLVLDVWAARRDNGANVQLWNANLSAAQKWRVSYDSEGLATITNVASGKVLDAQWGSSRPGTNVAQWSGNGSRAQKWKIVTGDKGRITIVSALDPSIVLDISAGGRFSGANVQLWTANGSDAQSFAFIPTKPAVSAEGQADIAPGYYFVSSEAS